MKCALYMDEGIQQVVITPESEFEKSIINNIKNRENEVSIKHGEFYACQGGWTRWSSNEIQNPNSLMLVLTEKNGEQ